MTTVDRPPDQDPDPAVVDHDPRPGLRGDRATWLYLVVLTALTVGVVGWAVVNPQEPATLDLAATDRQTALAPVGEPIEVELAISDDSVDLRGALPDDGAVSQLVALAEARYGEGNVTSALTVDPATTLTGGAVIATGTAQEGDIRPNGLQADVSAAFGLTAGASDVLYTESELTPVRADALVGAGRITLSGAFPDEAAAEQFRRAAEEIYGPENVDALAVTVDPETTLNQALFGISGLVDAGDTRAVEFQEKVLAFFGGTNADSSGLEIDTSPEALGRLEEKLRTQVEAEPILFASGRADLDPASDPILTRVAEAINATPGIDVEIVGHTDGEGSVEANQDISERRAQAVLDRLVALGVDPARLEARGAGESEPIADNSTEEGRAANRRIAFEFEGAG